MMGNMNEMMKQAQKLQKEMMKTQQELASKEYQSSAGGDMVKVTINGSFEIKTISISKEIVDPEDIEMLEDLVKAALNDATKQVNEASSDEMKGLTKGMNMPNLF